MKFIEKKDLEALKAILKAVLEDIKSDGFNTAFIDIEKALSILDQATEKTELFQKLCGNTRWLLDDLSDANETHHPESGLEYDSCKAVRIVLEKIEN
jgi:hypothetical protein